MAVDTDMSEARSIVLEIPDFCLALLIGATGAGKSTFAARWFEASEIVSLDPCRLRVRDHENDVSTDSDALDLAKVAAEKRLKDRGLAVIDAGNTRAKDRRPWIHLARRWHAPLIAIVIDPGLDACVVRNREREDGDPKSSLARRMIQEMRDSLSGLPREGFSFVWKLTSDEEVERARIARRPLPMDRRDDKGPFDIIGDVHGCAAELEALLCRLGYVVSREGQQVAVTAPHGRKLVFVGDLVDRGPRTPDVLRIVMAAASAGHALVVMGNHDDKLRRYLAGRGVKIAHGLEASVNQLDAETPEFREEVKTLLDGLPSHYWLDGGKLVVAHAGLKEEMIGRVSKAVREFALYGDTTGEVDEIGFPIRRDWASAYRGEAAVIYGHTPVQDPEWVNDTLCIDTGCAFGGKLTALRWPEREIVSVPAASAYVVAKRPLVRSGAELAREAAENLRPVVPKP
jgi:protein phosphatase